MEDTMQKLKISVLITGLTAITAVVNAIEPQQAVFAIKVATIEKMYQQDASNQGMDYPILAQYSDKDLQAAFLLEQAYFDREQMSCNIGHDILWDSQDPDYSQDKQFSITEQGLVKVSLAQGSDIYYELACTSIGEIAECKVADVILDEDIYDSPTLKSYLIKSCA